MRLATSEKKTSGFIRNIRTCNKKRNINRFQEHQLIILVEKITKQFSMVSYIKYKFKNVQREQRSRVVVANVHVQLIKDISIVVLSIV